MQFGFEKIDTEEIVEVYKVVIQFVEEAMGDQEQEQQQEGVEHGQTKSLDERRDGRGQDGGWGGEDLEEEENHHRQEDGHIG